MAKFKKDKAAAKALLAEADAQESYAKGRTKDSKLRMEDFADNKDDPILKRALNVINRVGEGRQKLANKLTNAYRRKNNTEARKIASEIIRNVKPLQSVESQMSKLETKGKQPIDRMNRDLDEQKSIADRIALEKKLDKAAATRRRKRVSQKMQRTKNIFNAKGGVQIKKAIGASDYRKGGLTLKTVDNRKKK